MSAPLLGIRVLDLSRLLPGPFCSMILADHGAEVIKIEEVGSGDSLRWYPPYAGDYSALFCAVNRNKKSITLNLRSQEGKTIFMQLVKDCDVILEGYRPGVMKYLGLDYEVLQSVNPRLIYCAITGYGQDGPRALEPGHDVNYLNLTGISSLIGYTDEAPPLSGVQIADLGGGALWGTIAILLALTARSVTGKGQFCDVSMSDGVISWLPFVSAVNTLDNTCITRGQGLLGGQFACYHIYPTADRKYMGLGALEPKFWQTFCKIISKPEFIDKQFDTAGQPELIQAVAAVIASKSQYAWIELFDGQEACFTPVKDLPEVMQDPHFHARSMWMQIQSSNNQFIIPAPPIKLAGTLTANNPSIPAHGQHNQEVLARLGYSIEQIESLYKQGII